MKATVAILSQWHREDPDRLLNTALRQAEQLARIFHSAVRLHEPRGLWPFKS